MNRLINYSLLLFITVSCRPGIDVIKLSSTLFNYNVNVSSLSKKDTLNTSNWHSFEVYMKASEKNELLSNTMIYFKVSSTKDNKSLFQLFNLKSKPISASGYFGDSFNINDSLLIDNKLIVKLRVDPPNDLGSWPVAITTKWNSIQIVTAKDLYVIK